MRLLLLKNPFQCRTMSTTGSDLRQSVQPVSRPRLPVPPLRKTLDRYLKSLRPFILEEEAKGGMPYAESYDLRAKWANEFEKGIGKAFQERLLALDRTSPHNWLDDNFWLKKAYHEWRTPLLIHSNWWVAGVDDNTVPADILQARDSSVRRGITSWQIRRAAWVIHRILDWRQRLDSQGVDPVTTSTGLWLRDSTVKIFNTSRLPRRSCDLLSLAPPASTPNARKIFVMLHDWFYAVEALDESCSQIAPSELERRLQAVVIDAQQRLKSGERATPVSVLTSDDRDRWADNLDYLLSLSPTNHAIFETINESLLALSLDHYTAVPAEPVSAHPQGPQPYPQAELDAHLINIRSGKGARNRWFDKPLDIILESSTHVGINGEHSPCDALVPSIILDYAVVQPIDSAEFTELSPSDLTLDPGALNVPGWERLDWVVDDKIIHECRRVQQRAEAIIADSDYSEMWFTDYGTEWIKTFANLSPDAYIQIAMQLAWYRTRGEFTATYETALTRSFDRGRTETIRSLTTESRSFVLSMVDDSQTAESRYSNLRRAVATHTALTREAATGKGIDRHLLGLQCVLTSEESASVDIFHDTLFQKSQEWKLSTSALSAGYQFTGTGFGTPFHDGYGINYLASPTLLKFGIESKFLSEATSTGTFKLAIMKALQDMRLACLEYLEHREIQSKL